MKKMPTPTANRPYSTMVGFRAIFFLGEPSSGRFRIKILCDFILLLYHSEVLGFFFINGIMPDGKEVTHEEPCYI
jgi:hypothetical protein